MISMISCLNWIPILECLSLDRVYLSNWDQGGNRIRRTSISGVVAIYRQHLKKISSAYGIETSGSSPLWNIEESRCRRSSEHEFGIVLC